MAFGVALMLAVTTDSVLMETGMVLVAFACPTIPLWLLSIRKDTNRSVSYKETSASDHHTRDQQRFLIGTVCCFSALAAVALVMGSSTGAVTFYFFAVVFLSLWAVGK